MGWLGNPSILYLIILIHDEAREVFKESLGIGVFDVWQLNWDLVLFHSLWLPL